MAALLQSERDQLAELLGECLALSDEKKRAAIIKRLPRDIRDALPPGANQKVMLAEMARRCSHYPGGLAALGDAVRYYEGESIPMQKLADFLAAHATATGPRPITVLHLSDLQFGKYHRFAWLNNTSNDPDATFDTLVARLEQDLAGLEHAPGAPDKSEVDLVVLSGDLAEWGMKSEFADVQSFCERLGSFLNLPVERVVVVPGNHDVNRKKCSGYFYDCEGDEEEPQKPYWPKWQPYAAMFQKLYRDSRATFTEDTPWSLFAFDELRLVVAGLNSTMAESHRDEDHHGWLGERQLRWFANELANYRKRGWLRLAVLHHNVRRGPVADDENLRDTEMFERILGDEVNLVLHGHTHDGKLDWLSVSGRVPVLSTGSAAVKAEQRSPEVPNQYQILRIHPARIERWTRGYAPDRKQWIADTRADPRGNNWHNQLDVKLVDVAATFPASSKPTPEPPPTAPGTQLDYAAHLPKYAEWARETFRHLPMVGLGGGDLKLTLDEVYVPLAFAPQVHRDPLDYTDKHEARRSTLDTPDKVDIREAFELAGQGRHLFVRGDPGTGKTTALKKMLWSLLDESSATGFDGRKLGLPAETVPVFLRLRGLAGPMRGRDFGEVLDRALARSIGQTASSVAPPGFGRWLWEQGNVLLLLDGLDEIGQRKERAAVCRYVENLAEAGYDRGIRVVASSRRAGVEGAVDLDHQQFLALDVRPLDDGQIDELVTRWFSAAGRALSRMKGEHTSRGEERARDEAQDLLAKLHRQATARIKGMLSTPLLLTLLCLTVKVKGGRIPQRRVEFFRECLDTLLGRWLTERTGRHLLSLDESLDLLEPVAWYLQTDEKGREDGISEAELRSRLRERINALASDRERQEAVHFQEVLEWFRVHTGVLREVCENHYGFMHLNLQEYLAALHAGHTDEIERLADKLGDPSWRE
ncbi:effector-associated domain 2-containing protein, partial [Haliangium sp.]|uniref:effector-associated domain 2-containing protein n=1 Tax=Haliangium sp. TaxID=2663208 RepID=UPI003D0C9A6A